MTSTSAPTSAPASTSTGLLAAAIALAAAACAPSRGPAPAAGAPAVPAAPTAVPAAIGETLTLASKLLGERRVINVYVPPGYAASAERYPVLYMPDGGLGEDFPHIAGAVDVSIKNAVIRPLIVVGIENTERRRDLVGPTEVASEREIAPHAGGADRFRAFLRDELKPMIAARYRTTSESAIIGESLAGLFVVETFLREPALFDAYLAVSPSVWWNEQALVRGANPPLALPRDRRRAGHAGRRGDPPHRAAHPGARRRHLALRPDARRAPRHDLPVRRAPRHPLVLRGPRPRPAPPRRRRHLSAVSSRRELPPRRLGRAQLRRGELPELRTKVTTSRRRSRDRATGP